VSTTGRQLVDQTELHEQEIDRSETPPVGEEIHLPGPSFIPVACAAGITLVVIGTTIGIIWIVLGLIVFLVSTGIWIRDTIRDVDALPEEHHH
jgi:Flp pilus assembly protein TadB